MRRCLLRAMNGVAIRSAVRGRERWQIESLRSRPRYAAAVEKSLSRHSAIRHVWANPLTGRLLVVYDPGVWREEVRDRVYSSLGLQPAEPEELHEWRREWPRGFNRLPERMAVEQARLRLLLSGTLFAGVVAKRLIFGAGMFAASPAFGTASAIMTILTGYTALRRGLDVVTAGGGLSGRTLLTAATLGILVASESLDGIGALVAAHAGELLELRAIQSTRTAVEVLDAWWRSDSELPPRTMQPAADPFEAFSTAALIASGGALLVTGDPRQSLAMLVGACPVAAPEARITARALSLRNANEAGIVFRHEETVSSLPSRVALVISGTAALQGATRGYGAALRAAGARRVLLLTSAPGTTAAGAGRRAGIREWRGNLQPDAKLDVLSALRAEGFVPVVVAGEEEGDPALLRWAEVGMAIVPRSAPEAIQAADVLLVDPNPLSVAAALHLMRRTSAIVRQDEWLSRLAGVAGFTAAAFGKLNLAGAQRLHNYTRLAMELNSLRLVSG
jgi:cation transport ATPase